MAMVLHGCIENLRQAKDLSSRLPQFGGCLPGNAKIFRTFTSDRTRPAVP